MMNDNDGKEPFSGPFVITGLSGAGKSVLSRSLEDIGYVCVDNIPLELVPLLFEQTEGEMDRLVVVLDIRTQGMVQRFSEFFQELKQNINSLRLIFVEASPEVLLRRFSVARRPHPLRDLSLEQAITKERNALEGVRNLADIIFETTELSPHDLRRQVLAFAGGDGDGRRMTLEVQSFSYQQGVPATASLVFDVRFLPNPFFEEELRRPLSAKSILRRGASCLLGRRSAGLRLARRVSRGRRSGPSDHGPDIVPPAEVRRGAQNKPRHRGGLYRWTPSLGLRGQPGCPSVEK
jgi:RNase adaptor protein for sRNA GlmZ degradation